MRERIEKEHVGVATSADYRPRAQVVTDGRAVVSTEVSTAPSMGSLKLGPPRAAFELQARFEQRLTEAFSSRSTQIPDGSSVCVTG
jgi:hypothetical protein